ncbi:MAG TPA: hypothetical protein PLY93_04285, partial [Turneriella sp.]|nr:hypothetical protein [Turneriella sp.]
MAVVEARSSLYRRAQQLTENDPREAEALYVKFIRETGAHKLKRAAYHELFALRLKEARLAEAFFQINKKSFRRRYVSAMEENLHLSNRRAQRLLSVLERECNPERDTEKLREYLEASKATVLEYNYVLRVQTLCGNNDTLAVLPELPVSNDDFDENKFYTAL